MDLREYLKTIKTVPEKQAFAERCGTSLNFLRMLACGAKPCSPELAIEIERESGGQVPAEVTCPSVRGRRVDWGTIRPKKMDGMTDGAAVPAADHRHTLRRVTDVAAPADPMTGAAVKTLKHQGAV